MAGQTLLDYLHVDLPALQGAGGLLLVLVALQLLTGVALMGLAPLTDQDYNDIKIGVKLLVLVVIAALVAVNLKKKPAAWLTPVLAGLVVLNVGIAVFWS